MEIGLKIWSTNTLSFKKINEFYQKKLIDYVELYVVPESFDRSKLEILRGIPVIFHAPHSKHGFNLNFMDKAFDDALGTLLRFSDFFEEKRTIIHPSFDKKDPDTSDQTIHGLKIFRKNGFDIIPENMPSVDSDGNLYYGSTYAEMKNIIAQLDCKFCLDIGHSICAANHQKLDPLLMIERMLSLKPYILHLSDGMFNSVVDRHLSYGEGDFPMGKIFEKIPSSGFLSMETPKKDDFANLNEDYKNIIRLKSYLAK